MRRHITSVVSNWFGDFAMSTFSPWFQNIINNSYVKLMKLDMSEFRDPSTYETL
ncbi:MAG: phosphatidylserine decarboxylase, partial [Sulfurovum sp.]